MIGAQLQTTDPQHTRAQRLTTAATAALSRITDYDELFGPIVETLIWLVAIDDLLLGADSTYQEKRDADPDGVVLNAIRYAHNAVLHGDFVIETVVAKPPATWATTAYATATYAQDPSIRWLSRPAIGFTPRPTTHLPDQESAYDTELAAHHVLPSLVRALAFLRDATAT
jgi:hypothetical protein